MKQTTTKYPQEENYKMKAERFQEISMCMVEQGFSFEEIGPFLVASVGYYKICYLIEKKADPLQIALIEFALVMSNWLLMNNNITFNNYISPEKEINETW